MGTSPTRAASSRSRLHSTLAVIVTIVLSIFGVAVSGNATPAMAAGSWVRGVPIDGGSGWLGTWIPYSGQPTPGLCIDTHAPNPTAELAVTPGQLTSQPSLSRPADLTVNISQMAYIMKKWTPTSLEFSDSDTDAAATAFLVHLNFETAANAQANVNEWLSVTPAYIQTRAKQMVAEAKQVGVVDWEEGAPTGEGQRFGTVDGIGVLNDSGQYIAGKPFTITLSGPIVFEETGTATLTGTTANTVLNGFKWRSTGNGTATYSVRYDDLGSSTVGHANPGDGHQAVIFDDYTARSETVQGPSWDVIFDFQPMATSNVGDAKISDDGVLKDTLTVFADPDYGDGQWVEIDGKPVPVVFEGTAFDVGETPVSEPGVVPEGAKVVGTATVTATGPGEYETPTIEGVDPNMANWVWKVVKENQGDNAIYVHADWSDQYGLADETTSVRREADIDSTLSIRETKSGTYLVDDVWVTGFPSDHPDFEGGAGFKADAKTITHKVLFFPEDLPVLDENADKAELIGQVELPAKNGFYPSVGATDFKTKGQEVGTYVFVSEFAGDDRVKAFTSSVTDETEQYVVLPTPPTLQTTATNGEDGTKVLPNTGTVKLDDKVCYTDLKPGKEYELEGTLMDKATNSPILVDGKPLVATTKHTPTKADDCATVTFEVDASVLAGKTTVVFERLMFEGRVIAVHTDINDEGQTVTTPETPTLKTTATNAEDGTKVVTPKNPVKLDDKVCYTNLTPGKEYEIQGTLQDFATEKPYQVGGKDVTATVKHTPTKANDCAVVPFEFDGSGLKSGMKLVVFEDLLLDGNVIAVHADINDEGQTVTVEQPSIPPLAKTGAGGWTLPATFALLSVLAGSGLFVAAHRRRFPTVSSES